MKIQFPTRFPVPFRLTLLGLSLLSFIAAMPLTAYAQAKADEPTVTSYIILMIGWGGLLMGYIEWLANPLLLWSWLASYFNRPRASGWTALCAFSLALIFLCRHEMLSGGQAGGTVTIVRLGAGYWLWLGSALLMVIANLDELLNGLKRKPPAQQ